MQKSAKGWEETLMRRVLIVGIIYMIKAFTWRFVLDAGKLRNFHNSVKNEATVDVHGCVTPRQRYALFYRVYQRFGIHIGVGFCVARSTELGNAKASQRGTGDGMDSHAFFVYVLLIGFVIKGVDLLYCLRNWMNILQNLALKRRDAIAEGWYPLNCYVGDFLRHM